VKPLTPTPEQRKRWRVKKLCFGTHGIWSRRRGWARIGAWGDLRAVLDECDIPYKLLRVVHRRTKRSKVRLTRYMMALPSVLADELEFHLDGRQTRQRIRMLAHGPGSVQWQRWKALCALAGEPDF